jgi:alginate O-acetyltransferase complex protein AlgI
VLWGAMHGTFLILERWIKLPAGMTVPTFVRWLYALLVVMGGWVLFRADDLPSAGAFYAGLIGAEGMGSMGIPVHLALNPMTVLPMLIGCVLAVAPRWHIGRGIFPAWSLRFTREATLFGMLLLSLLLVAAGTYSPFLYFRF